MQVIVKLHGVFRLNRFKEKCIGYPPGTIVQDVVQPLQLPDHILGIVLVNDVHCTINTQLKDGDTLILLPLLDGG